jgi:hypothetical protein
VSYVPLEEDLEDLLKKVEKASRMKTFSAFVMEKLGYENYESCVFHSAIELDGWAEEGGPEFIWKLLNASVELKYDAAIRALQPGTKPDAYYDF